MALVSVVIPTHNRADVLGRAIDSVFAQTMTDFELIVVDDCSTDETQSVVTGYDDERVEYVRLEENQGANSARNTGISASEGDFISFLDSDDEFYPTHLEVVVKRLSNTDTSCAGAFTAFEHVRNGSVFTISEAPDGYITQDQVIAENIVGGFSTVTLRSEVFTEVGPLDEEMPAAQDIEYFIRLLERYSLQGIDRPLVKYHHGADQISDDVNSRIAGQNRLLEKHGEKMTQAGRSRIYSSRAFANARNDDLAGARRNFGRAIRVDPTNYLAWYHYAACLFGNTGFRISLQAKQRLKRALYR
ncbi:glycosyltransferase [Halobacteria archaeon HArc-gm2]|nr:glycosyltransferase [Halobacteria archaeon HArc-gm2]